MTTLAQSLATAYEKPLAYVELCIKTFSHPKTWPIVRYAGDGFDEFFSSLTAFYDNEPSRTKQEFTAEVDINNIMARFAASGYDPTMLPLTTRKPIYGDLTSMPDSYHAALNYVKDTERSFMELPAAFRAKLDNDPQLFLNYIQDPANYDELVELGFLLPKQTLPSDRQESGGEGIAIPSGGSMPPEGNPSKKAVKTAKGDSGD